MLRLASPLRVPPPREAARVTLADPAPGADVLRPALEAYARALEAPVTLHAPPEHYRAPLPPTALHVHCFAMPRRPLVLGVWPRVPLVRVPFAFGHALPFADTWGFAPAPRGGRAQILADGEGQPVVETTGANLYILWDLLPQGELAPLLLRRCLDLGLAACPALARGSPLRPPDLGGALAGLARDTADAEAAWRARQREEGGRRFHAAVRARRDGEAERLRHEVARLEHALEEYGRRITAETRLLAERRRRLAALEGLPAEPADILRELDRVRVLPQVRQADLREDALVLITRPLEAECGGHRYRLGAFRVEIQLEGDVRIFNLTDAREHYDHPHVRHGRPCLGNAREGVAKLIGEYEFAAAAQVLLDFLETVNPHDWRIPVFYWPRVDP